MIVGLHHCESSQETNINIHNRNASSIHKFGCGNNIQTNIQVARLKLLNSEVCTSVSDFQ